MTVVVAGTPRTAYRLVKTKKPSGKSTRMVFSFPRAVTRQSCPFRAGSRDRHHQTYSDNAVFGEESMVKISAAGRRLTSGVRRRCW